MGKKRPGRPGAGLLFRTLTGCGLLFGFLGGMPLIGVSGQTTTAAPESMAWYIDPINSEASSLYPCSQGWSFSTAGTVAACCTPNKPCETFVTGCSAGTLFQTKGVPVTCVGEAIGCFTRTYYKSYPSADEKWLGYGCLTRRGDSVLGPTAYLGTIPLLPDEPKTSLSRRRPPFTGTESRTVTDTAETVTGTMVIPGSPSDGSSPSNDNSSSSGGPAANAWIASAVIGPLAAIALIGGLGFWLGRRRRRHKDSGEKGRKRSRDAEHPHELGADESSTSAVILNPHPLYPYRHRHPPNNSDQQSHVSPFVSTASPGGATGFYSPSPLTATSTANSNTYHEKFSKVQTPELAGSEGRKSHDILETGLSSPARYRDNKFGKGEKVDEEGEYEDDDDEYYEEGDADDNDDEDGVDASPTLPPEKPGHLTYHQQQQQRQHGDLDESGTIDTRDFYSYDPGQQDYIHYQPPPPIPQSPPPPPQQELSQGKRSTRRRKRRRGDSATATIKSDAGTFGVRSSGGSGKGPSELPG